MNRDVENLNKNAFEILNRLNLEFFLNTVRGESAALGRSMPWANRLFSKSMKGKILNFLHEDEKMILVISVQV